MFPIYSSAPSRLTTENMGNCLMQSASNNLTEIHLISVRFFEMGESINKTKMFFPRFSEMHYTHQIYFYYKGHIFAGWVCPYIQLFSWKAFAQLIVCRGIDRKWRYKECTLYTEQTLFITTQYLNKDNCILIFCIYVGWSANLGKPQEKENCYRSDH